MKLDIKSLAVGLLAGIAITLSIAANGAEDPKNSPGRYQIEAASYAGHSFYVIDTQTGQVWTGNDKPK